MGNLQFQGYAKEVDCNVYETLAQSANATATRLLSKNQYHDISKTLNRIDSQNMIIKQQSSVKSGIQNIQKGRNGSKRRFDLCLEKWKKKKKWLNFRIAKVVLLFSSTKNPLSRFQANRIAEIFGRSLEYRKGIKFLYF